jgi:hypothetical protein
MSGTSDTPALACIPAAIPLAERPSHFALAMRLFLGQAQEHAKLKDGHAFRFPSGSLEAVARFIANERKCCPFIAFELTLAPAAASFWLRMTGPEGTRQALDAALRLAHLGGGNSGIDQPADGRTVGSAGTSCGPARGNEHGVGWTAAGSLVTALGVCAACCLPPFALLSGVASAWVGSLELLAPHRWILLVVTIVLLGCGLATARWRGTIRLGRKRERSPGRPASMDTLGHVARDAPCSCRDRIPAR